jgi:putative hydrolase of the HAD superfamily
MIRALSLDFGETLTTLDADLLVEKLARRGVQATAVSLERALPAAWQIYQTPAASAGHHPWKPFMTRLLELAGCSFGAALVEDLFEDQQRQNLWRRPLPGMSELVRDAHAAGVPVAVVSNSEGFLLELVAELGWTDDLPIVFDSGKLGVAKPEPEIFRLAAERLGVALTDLVHVGDSLRADVHGALGAGARPIWFTCPPSWPTPPTDPPAGVTVCSSAAELRAALGLASRT